MPKYRTGGRFPKSTTRQRTNEYRVVLYCNMKRKKIFYKSKIIYPARRKYQELLEENVVYFPKEWDWLGNKLNYELVLLGTYGEGMHKYEISKGIYRLIGKTKDGFIVKDIQPYYVEERFKYYNGNQMIYFKDLIKMLLLEKYSKTITPLNNKVIIEIFETEDMHLFILKNKKDAKRLTETIKTFYYENKIADCFFFNEPKVAPDRKELYKKIEEKVGMPKSEIIKVSTH